MKKRLLYLFMLICSVSLFTSCGDDDDDVKYPVDSELAGAYKGTMDVYYVGVSTPIASDMVQKVYISKASDTAVKLELKNFTIPYHTSIMIWWLKILYRKQSFICGN